MRSTRLAVPVLFLFLLLTLLAPLPGFPGDAPFGVQQVVALSADEPRSIAFGDLDGDGDADLVSASIADGQLAWYANLGDGSFGSEQGIASGLAFVAVLVFDADGDGDLDVLCGISGPEKPRWYENTDGAGTFELGRVIDAAPGETTVLAVADLDRDGDADILGATASPLPGIQIYSNSGDGTFSASDTLGAAGASFTALATADLDRDGDLEIVSGGELLASVGTALAWWENVGEGWTLHGIGSFGTVDALAVADLDRDGRLDVLVAGEGVLSWQQNVPDPGVTFPFDENVLFSSGGEVFSSVLTADLDGDGDPDVVGASGGGIRWFENASGSGGFASANFISTKVEGATQLAVDDLDDDGDLDLVSASADDDKLAVYRNKRIHRSARFFTEQVIDPAVEASSLVCADLNLDGVQDLVYADLQSEALYWSPNLGGFTSAFEFSIIDDVRSLDVADFEGDGSPDVVSGARAEGRLAWHPNHDAQGPGDYQSITESFFEAYLSVRAADMDGDGDQDVVTGSDLSYLESAGDGNVVWWENDGTPGEFPDWQRHVIGNVDQIARSVAPIDLDRDGDLDVIVGATGFGEVAIGELVWFRNDGNRSVGESLVDRPDDDTYLGNVIVAVDAPFDVDGYVRSFTFLDPETPGRMVTPLILERISPESCLTIDPAGCVYAVRGIGATRSSSGSDSPQTFAFEPVAGSSARVLPHYLYGWKDGSTDNGTSNGGAIDSQFGANDEPATHMQWGLPAGGPALGQDGTIDNLAWNFRTIGGRDYSVQFEAEGFSRQPIEEGVDGFRSVASGDLDGDGDPDIVSVRGSAIYWHASELPGTSWPDSLIAPDFENGSYVSTADLDADGDLDVLSISASDGKYAWYENLDGAGTFGEQQVLATIWGEPTQLASADLDRDGDLDVVGAAFGDGKSPGQVALYLNEGGQFRLGTADLAPAASFDGQLVPLLAISMVVNSRPGDAVGKLATLALALDAGFDPEVVQFDLGSAFNADVIVNDGPGGLDLSQEPIDLGSNPSGNFAFVTQSAAGGLCAFDPDGIPDDGFFPANTDHPDVQLAYRNTDDGDNARRSSFTTDSFSFPVPPDRYSEVHLFATTGEGDSEFVATLHYDDESSQASSFTVPDWFDDPPPGNAYYLVDEVDRVQPGNGPGDLFGCEDNDDPAIFGFPILADPARTLVSVTVDRLDADGVLNIFGATGLRGEVTLDSAEANALIEELRVYRDDGSGQFEQGVDKLVETFETLDLGSGGLQTLVLEPQDEGDLVVALPATFLLVAELTQDASTQPKNALRLTHLAGSSTAENSATGVGLLAEPPLDLQYVFASTRTVVQPAYDVDSAGDEPDSDPGDATCGTPSATCTLRAAVQEANARSGDDLILVPAQFGPYVLTEPEGDLDIENNGRLTIRGAGPVRPVIDAAGFDRVFDVLDGATLILEGLAITGGDAQAESGGGIRTGTNSVLTVDRCEITGNTAFEGGGLLGGAGASVEILDSTIANNTASSGGGISILATALVLRGSTISDNDAVTGGGLYTTQGTWTVSNSTVSGNATAGPGSAAIDGGEPGSKFLSATITANSGGGIVGAGASIDIGNSIVAVNGIDLSGAFRSLGHNLIGDLGSATGFVDGLSGDQVGSAGAPIVPLVAPLAANGGETSTHALLPGSPAVDAGNCPGQTLDQRGKMRAVDLPNVDDAEDGDGCDIGAYESEYGSVLLPLEIPVRWCAVAGAPSQVDPGLVGADTVSEVLRHRLDRATEHILEPNAGIVLRSGATEAVEFFPVLPDPQTTIGQPGDVFIDPETANFDEFLQLVSDCRAAWELLDPTVVGITAVHINQFVDQSGDPLPILGLGGRGGQNNAAEQLAAGRVMVVDSFYRLGVDPFDSLLAHEAGHALSLEHGNGRDDDEDTFLDNDDDKFAGLPKFDGPNLMQYRKGTQLTQGQVERARTHAFVTIPDSTINLAGVLTDAGTIDPGLSRVLDFGFSRVLDFSIEDVQDFGLSKVLDFGFSKVLDFGLSKVLDFGLSRVLDFGFSRVLDFGMVYGSEGLEGSATIASTTGGVFWPSPIRPEQTLLYYLDVDDNEGTGGNPAEWDFPAEGTAMGIDLIVQVHIRSICTEDACVDEQAATAFRFVDTASGYVEDAQAVPGDAAVISQLTVGLVVDNGGDEVEIDDQKMAAIVTTEIKSGVLVEAGARIGAPLRIRTLSFIDCATALPGGGSTIPIGCQCEDCTECPDYPGCVGSVGQPETVPSLLLVDTAVGLVTFDAPALPRCTVEPSVAAPGTTVKISATNFTVGASLQISVDGAVFPFDNPLDTRIVIPGGTTAVKLSFAVEPVDPLGTLAQVGKCSVVINSNACGDADGDGCDDCSIAPLPGDPSHDGPDFDEDGLCDAGDPDDDDDGVEDPSDLDPKNNFVCGFAEDADACDDCSSGTLDPANDGVDTDGDGMCDAGDTDDDGDLADDLLDPEGSNPLVCGDAADHDGCDDCSSGQFQPLQDGIDTDEDGICAEGDPDDNDPAACGDFADQDGCDDCSQGAFDPENDGPDADLDGICDLGDSCTDVDGDGLGNGNLGNVGCAPSQAVDSNDGDPSVCADTNQDGCDDCSTGIFDPTGEGLDSDQDGLCDGVDNCPGVANPHQSDYDFDGDGNECDTCTDRDEDGWGAGQFPANDCGQDNCPAISNPGQADYDGNGIGDVCEQPKFSTAPNHPVLWPPNHRMVDVEVSIESGVPAEYLSIVLLRVASDEPDNGRSDGDTTSDIQNAEIGTADLHVRLRAERTRLGQGRHYALLYEVTNVFTGESSQASLEIRVPLEQDGSTEPLALTVLQQDGATVLQWEAVSGATDYDVVRGELASLHKLGDRVDLGPVTCIASRSQATNTAGSPDAESPLPDQAFFYLVQYHGDQDSSYGTESSSRPRIPAAGECE